MATKTTKPKTEKKQGRRCSICSHKQTSAINKAITDGQSFRSIALKFGMSDVSVHRHVQNCLNIELVALIQEKKLEQAIDVHREFEKNLAFANKLRTAAEEYLEDPNNPLKLTIIPRAEEIDVVYYEYPEATISEDEAVEGKTKPEKPVKKTAKLQMLLRGVETLRNVEVDKVSIKHLDLRSFALDAIRTADLCIDKFAKLAGSYQKDKENTADAELVRLKASIERRAAEKEITYEDELKNYLENYSEHISIDIRTQLASDLAM